MKKVIVITGTPGVGKTTLSAKIKHSLKDSRIYGATALVNRFNLYSGKDKFGSKIVKMAALEKKIREIVAKEKGSTIIFEGHLLADIRIKGAIAIVIREHLITVKKRLLQRGYPTEKVRENIVSEALDYCGVSAYDNYAKVYEILNGREAKKQILSIIEGKQKKKQSQINLLEELVSIIKKDRKFAI